MRSPEAEGSHEIDDKACPSMAASALVVRKGFQRDPVARGHGMEDCLSLSRLERKIGSPVVKLVCPPQNGQRRKTLWVSRVPSTPT